MVKDDGGSVDKGHSLTLSNITNTSTDECDEEEIDTAQVGCSLREIVISCNLCIGLKV